MPEIKNNFLKGRMNKDLDERLIPQGEYRDAMNIQVATSEGSDVGTVQNILGNLSVENIIPSDCKCVGCIEDEKNNNLYWFVKREYKSEPGYFNFEAILEYSVEFGVTPVLVDTKVNTSEAVLKFPDKIITGINIIDGLLFFTDGVNEPRKINISQCKKGTTDLQTHTKLFNDFGSFDGLTINTVGLKQDDNGNNLAQMVTTLDDSRVKEGRYFYFEKDQFDKLFENEVVHASPNADDNSESGNINPLRHYRDGEFLGVIYVRVWNNGSGNGMHARLTAFNTPGTFFEANRYFKVGDVLYGNNISRDIKEENITAIKKSPKTKLGVKINTTENKNKELLFERIFPRFSYRYKYNDNEYSTFAPFTDIVFNPEHKDKYSLDVAYDVKEPYNTSMLNVIDSVELTDFINSDTDENVKQVDILYKKEDSPTIHSIASIKRIDGEWYEYGSGQQQDVGYSNSILPGGLTGNSKPAVYGGLFRGKYIINSQHLNNALPENQLLRPWDALPRKALAQEITGNRIVYGNYVQGYNLDTKVPKFVSDYVSRKSYNLPFYDFNSTALPSIKSQRNYEIGIVFGDKYGRETPVFTSNKGSVLIPWRSKYGNLSSTQSYQLNVTLQSKPPSFAEYIKYFVKETSGDYYNLIMDKVYVPADISEIETKQHLWLSFPSSERNKVSEDDYLILKKKIGSGETQIQEKNKFKILDIKNEAPDFVKFEYGLIFEFTQATEGGTDFLDDLFNISANATDESQLLKKGNTTVSLDKTSFLANTNFRPAYDKTVGGTYPEDLYLSWFRFDGDDVGLCSDKYRIIDILVTGPEYILQLEKPISEKDDVISGGGQGTSGFQDLGIRLEKRKERKPELLSGKFFVKVLSQPIVYGDILDDTSLLDKFVWLARKKTFYLNDVQTSGDSSVSGIVHAQTFDEVSTTATNNSPFEHNGNLNTTRTQNAWAGVIGEMEDEGRAFFIDAMFMKAGQISDSNYAKTVGATWAGSMAHYPKLPIWVGRTIEPQGYTDGDVITVNSEQSNVQYNTSYTYGWKYINRQWEEEPGTISIKNNSVNGLEGIITTDATHVGDFTFQGDGIRRWRAENSTGSGLHETQNSLDYTYGKEEGKFFMHLSFLSPGEDLVDTNEIGGPNNANAIYGEQGIGRFLQGIWGGGVITAHNGEPFTNIDDIIIPMEGKYPIDDNDDGSEPPGPGVPNSFGYDEKYRARHENQWNPCWPTDPDGKTQEFINNIRPGSKFKFEADTNNTIYTIKKVTIKKIYNHTSWRNRRLYDGNDYDGVGSLSVFQEGRTWANSIDATNPNGDAADLLNFKKAIHRFGQANNRRLCYIIELDKNPKDATYDPSDGSTLNVVTGSGIQFLAQASSFIELDAEKPIIWETEAKQSINAEIYHEATDAIPIKINSNTNELLAPVGCIVETLGENDFDAIEQTTAYTFASENLSNNDYTHQKCILKRWIDDTTFELDKGFRYSVPGTTPKVEIDYSNYKIRFTKKDGSYVIARLAAQTSDPNNSLGYGGADGFKNIFTINPDVSEDLQVGLSWYNCFSFGNGLESNRIQDGFNEMKITNGPVVSSTIDDDYIEEQRTSGLIYSGIYNANSSINNLNQFITAEQITKDLNPTYGSIQKLFQRRVGLVAFCEDRIVDIVAGKDTLFNADGNPQLVASNRVLGTATPFVGDYGISKNPESFASESYRAYFTDKQRGAVLRLSMDGLTPISDIGMTDWFRDNIMTPNELIGTYDEYKKEYNLTLKSDFSENLLKNSGISEGEELVNINPTPSNLIQNGEIVNTTNLNTPEMDQTSSAQNMMTYNDSHFPQETIVVNYPEIPLGYFQEQVSPQTETIAQYTVFQLSSDTIIDLTFPSEDGTFPISSSSTTTVSDIWDSSNTWANSSPTNLPTSIPTGPFEDINPGSLDSQGGWILSRDVDNNHPSTFNNYVTADDGEPYYKNISGPNPTQSNPGTDVGFVGLGGAPVGMFGSLGWQWYEMYFGSSYNKTASVMIPHKHQTGVYPDNLVPTAVSTWGPGLLEHDVTLNAGSNNHHFSSSGTEDYSSAHNLSIFAGEEIKVSITLTVLDSSKTTPRLRLFGDGNLVTSDNLVSVTNGPWENPNNASGVKFSKHQNDPGNSPSSLTYPNINPDPSGNTYVQSNMGYQPDGTVLLPPSNMNSTAWSTVGGWAPSGGGGSHVRTFTFEYFFKFKNPGSLTVGQGASGAVAAKEGKIFDTLKFAIDNPAMSVGSYYPIISANEGGFNLDNFKVEKVFKFTQPYTVGQPFIQQQLPIPSYTVPAWASVENKLKFPNKWNISGANVLYGASKLLCSHGISVHGPDHLASTDTATTLGANPQTFSWPVPATSLPSGTGTFAQPTSISGANISFGSTSYNEYDATDGNEISLPIIQTPNSNYGSITPKQITIDYGNSKAVYINTTSTGTVSGNASGIHFNSNQFDGASDLTALKTADKWLMVDVVIDQFSGTDTINNKGVLVRRLIDPAVYTDTASTYWNSNFFASSIPYGSFGNFNIYSTGNPAVGTDRGFRLLDPEQWPQYNNMHGYDLVGIDSAGYFDNSILNTNYKLYRAVVKVDSNSANVDNATDDFKVQFYNVEGNIRLINVRDISEKQTGGELSEFSYTSGLSGTGQWQTSNPTTSWELPDYGGSDQLLVVNSIHRKSLFAESGRLKFRNASAPGHIVEQEFSNISNSFDFLPAQDNYEFEFTIENLTSGEAHISLRTPLFMPDAQGNQNAEGYYLKLIINENGVYKITFNVEEGNENISSIEKDNNTYSPNTSPTITIHTSTNNENTLRIHNKDYYPTFDPVIPLSCDFRNIRLFDASNLITGGSVDFWEFVGFDATDDDFIFFNDANENIELNNAPTFTEIRQIINTNVLDNSKYKIKFNHQITSGAIRVYYFNTAGNGFVTEIINSSGYYNQIHSIGESTAASSGITNPLKNTFVVELIDASGDVTGTLDNFSMQKVIEFDPTTLSFSEKTKGWISFKSFTPENGLSLAKQYYTLNQGKLFKHHTNENRNQFYGENITDITESSVTMIFNQDPSLIKTFNTLNYEGTQSQIYKYNDNYIDETIKPYNVSVSSESYLKFPAASTDYEKYSKLGWYVNYIITDNQVGTVKEFVEKEGKWFNYIRGSSSADLSTAEFSFQGIGEVVSVSTIPSVVNFLSSPVLFPSTYGPSNVSSSGSSVTGSGSGSGSGSTSGSGSGYSSSN